MLLISIDRWHADHIKPLMRDCEYITERLDNGRDRLKVVKTGTALHPENDTLENFYPACVPCNLHKGGHTVDTWRASLQKKTEELMRDSSAYRHAKRFGLIVETGAKVVFYFEQASS